MVKLYLTQLSVLVSVHCLAFDPSNAVTGHVSTNKARIIVCMVMEQVCPVWTGTRCFGLLCGICWPLKMDISLPFDCRSCPLYRQACQANKADGSAAATVFVNTGHAGASLGFDIDTKMASLAIFESVSISHGYTRTTVNRTDFTLEVIPPTIHADFTDHC